jgi:hypothetical protein
MLDTVVKKGRDGQVSSPPYSKMVADTAMAPALQPRSKRFGNSEVGLTHAQIAS